MENTAPGGLAPPPGLDFDTWGQVFLDPPLTAFLFSGLRFWPFGSNVWDVAPHQPLLCRQHPEAAHGLPDDLRLIQVWTVCSDALPVLLQPQLKACLWPAVTRKGTKLCLSFTPNVQFRCFIYRWFSETGGGASACFCRSGSLSSSAFLALEEAICSRVDWVCKGNGESQVTMFSVFKRPWRSEFSDAFWHLCLWAGR